MRKFRILLVGLILSGCATPYQKNGLKGGYEDMKLSKDMFQVSFRGNGYTSGDVVQKYFLRRCAELTIEQGFDHFAIVDQEADAATQIKGTRYNGTVSEDSSGDYSYRGTASTKTVTRHSRTGTIKLFKEGNEPPISFEAREVMSNFKEHK